MPPIEHRHGPGTSQARPKAVEPALCRGRDPAMSQLCRRKVQTGQKGLGGPQVLPPAFRTSRGRTHPPSSGVTHAHSSPQVHGGEGRGLHPHRAPRGHHLIGILAAIAIPVFLNQRKKAVEASLKSDARTVANEEETYYTDSQSYVAVGTLAAPVASPLTIGWTRSRCPAATRLPSPSTARAVRAPTASPCPTRTPRRAPCTTTAARAACCRRARPAPDRRRTSRSSHDAGRCGAGKLPRRPASSSPAGAGTTGFTWCAGGRRRRTRPPRRRRDEPAGREDGGLSGRPGWRGAGGAHRAVARGGFRRRHAATGVHGRRKRAGVPAPRQG